MEKIIKVAAIQPELTPDHEKNMNNIDLLIEKAVKEVPDIICLPERWWYINPFECNHLEIIQKERGFQYQKAQAWAKKYNVSIISGAIWEKRANYDKPFITSYYFNDNGKEIGRQDKIQLYKLEKTIFEQGKELNIFSQTIKREDRSFDYCFSILICFDLHLRSDFVEKAIDHGSEIIFSPTLILSKGEEHWETYIKARALENRIPIVSVNSILSYEKKQFLGKSKIIQFLKGPKSPVKFVIDKLDEKPDILTKEINLTFPNKLRKSRLRDFVNPESIDIKKMF